MDVVTTLSIISLPTRVGSIFCSRWARIIEYHKYVIVHSSCRLSFIFIHLHISKVTRVVCTYYIVHLHRSKVTRFVCTYYIVDDKYVIGHSSCRRIGPTTFNSYNVLIWHSGLGTENTVSQRIQTNMHKIGKMVMQWE